MADMSDFQRDVIDRLARIETNAANASNLATIVTLQGARLDVLDRKFQTLKDRVWSLVIIAPLVLPVIVDYVRIRLFNIRF